MRERRQANRDAPACLPGEEWRPIAGYTGYEVSSLGRVRVVRILGPQIGLKGYARVNLFNRAGRRTHFVHRLVCEAWRGSSSDLQVAHLDGNSGNNRADNLAWVTQAENEAHKIIHRRGERAFANNAPASNSR